VKGDTMSTTATGFAQAFVKDFAAAIKAADSKGPKWRSYRPGIGPHPEIKTIHLVMNEIKNKYSYNLQVKYPKLNYKCDLCIGHRNVWSWAIEIKLLRVCGDKGAASEHFIKYMLSPYSEHHSAITDCLRLMKTTLAKNKAFLIIAYDSCLDKMKTKHIISLFEFIISHYYNIKYTRISKKFKNLMHPILKSGTVYMWKLQYVSSKRRGANRALRLYGSRRSQPAKRH